MRLLNKLNFGFFRSYFSVMAEAHWNHVAVGRARKNQRKCINDLGAVWTTFHWWLPSSFSQTHEVDNSISFYRRGLVRLLSHSQSLAVATSEPFSAWTGSQEDTGHGGTLGEQQSQDENLVCLVHLVLGPGWPPLVPATLEIHSLVDHICYHCHHGGHVLESHLKRQTFSFISTRSSLVEPFRS